MRMDWKEEFRMWRAVLLSLAVVFALVIPGAYGIKQLSLGYWASMALVVALSIAISAVIVYGLRWILE